MMLKTVISLLWLFAGILVGTKETPAIQTTMDNYWRFDFSTGFADSITNTSSRLHGNHSNISIQGSSEYNGYLVIKDHSSVELNGLKSTCFSYPVTCVSGVSMALWFRDPVKDQATYLESKGDAFSLLRHSNDSLVVRVLNNTAIHESRFWLNTSVWNHIAFTWDLYRGLMIYKNSRNVKTHTYVSHTLSSKALDQLQNSKNHSISLYGRAYFDDVMVWHRTLAPLDIKKIFQAQINSILDASCKPGTTSLNVSWQHARDVYNTIASYYVRLRKGKKSRKVDAFKLSKTATSVVFENLLPMTSYRIKIWAETEDDDIIKTEVVRCKTEEGEPERVINFQAVPRSSSSVFMHWVPPSRINGLLQGYQINMSDSFTNHSYFIHGKQSYLVEKLKDNTTFDLKIAAVNSRGPGLVSTGTVRTKQIPIIKTQPKVLHATATDWGTIHVQWLPMDPAMEVKSYEVRVCKDTQCTTKHSKRPSVLIEGLEQYTAYNIKIRGTNRRSKGPWEMLRQMVYTLDFDECKGNQHPCSRYASCHNTHGSFFCTCLPGYGGNGTRCTKLDSEKVSACDFQIAEDLSWQWTNVGQEARALCPKGTEGIAERVCRLKDGKATWSIPNLEKCISERILNIQNRLFTEDMDKAAIADISNELAQATSLTNGLTMYGGDVTAIVKIIKKLDDITAINTAVMEKDSQKQFSANIVRVASNILDAVSMKSWNQIPVSSRREDASLLLGSLDSITMATTSLLTDSEPVMQNTSNVVVNMQSFLLNRMFGYVEYPIVSFDNTSISLPLDDVKPGNNEKGNKTHVSFIYLKNIGLLLTEHDRLNQENKTEGKEQETSASHVVLSLSTRPKPTKLFTKPVVIILHNPQHEEGMEPLCVYWNQSTAHSGSWSQHGCSVNSSNATHTVCHCNHLTSFSVLMQHSSVSFFVSNRHHFALGIITYVGIGFSTVALLLALLTFIGCTFLKSTRNFAHINLTLSLLIAEVLFLVGIDKTQYFLPCRVIAIFLHYLFLVVFCWMASEGIILYLMLVRVFPSQSSGPRKRLFFVCSWGLPCVFVALTSSLYLQGYGNDDYCWLSIDDGFIWSFLAPILLISSVNLVFLAMTFKAMASRSTPQSVTKKKTFRHWAKACGVLTCLLGTTWLLGLFYVNQDSLVMAYLFNIFNSLQGLLIFIFHCVFDDRVRAEYYRILCCRGSRRDRLRKKSTGTLIFRKLTSASSAQIRKSNQDSTDGKATSSGLRGVKMDSSQNGMVHTFDSDSLLTINKTSADENCMADEHEVRYRHSLEAPIISSGTEFDSMDRKKKEQSWGEYLRESLFNVSSLEESDSRSSKGISRPHSEDASGLSLPRSKEYYSDGDYNRHTTDLSDIFHSENEIGSNPVIQTEEGTVVKLGRCKICSNDSYQMVCVHAEDNLTQASFEFVEESPQFHSTTDGLYSSSSITVPSVRVSDSILTGFLRDEHPNPKIINHRWTHIPYIKRSDQIAKKDFMTESTSCDDRFLHSQGETTKTLHSSEISVDRTSPSIESVRECSKTSLHEDGDDKGNGQGFLDLNKHEDQRNTIKPVGLVVPMMAPSLAEQQDEVSYPPVALCESSDELCDLDWELDEKIHVTNTSSDDQYKTAIQPIKPVHEHPSARRDSTASRHPIYPHSTTVTRKEMTAIKQGIVERLGMVFESGWQNLHSLNAESEPQEKNENEMKRTTNLEKKAQTLPGNVKNLREMFETRPELDNPECLD